MIDFMLIGLPRSGTTWAANWLTSSDVYCVHDPLYKVHYSQWDTDRVHFPHPMLYNTVGVSCTGIWRWPEFVNEHPARKIVVRRDYNEVNDSLDKLGLPLLSKSDVYALHKINGEQIPYEHLFNPDKAPEIWNHLTGSELGYCPIRHAQLCEFNVEPFQEKVYKDEGLQNKLIRELEF